MHAFDVIGYAYEADIHCPDCAYERFGKLLDESDTTDSEGNPIHPVFASDIHFDESECCGDCFASLIEE